MLATCNVCRDHNLPLSYICMNENCPCTAKRYCERCTVVHNQNHNSKCISYDEICLKIKTSVKPCQKVRKDTQKLKENCRNLINNKEKRDKQALDFIYKYGRDMEEKMHSFQQSVRAQSGRVKRIHKDQMGEYLKQLGRNQLLNTRVTLANASGLLFLHKMVAKSKQAYKRYDQILDSLKKYGSNDEEIMRKLALRQSTFYRSLTAALDQIYTLEPHPQRDQTGQVNRQAAKVRPELPPIPSKKKIAEATLK